MSSRAAAAIPKALRPLKNAKTGKWTKAKVSGRKAAIIRKNAIANGLVKGPEAQLEKGEWCMAWDRQKVFMVPKPLRGQIAMRKKQQRVESIDRALEAYDARIANETIAKRDARPTNYVEWLQSKELWPGTAAKGKGKKK